MSRTLGFIAGLTVPAGLYYISTLHLNGTSTEVVSSLDQQEKRLRKADQLPAAQLPSSVGQRKPQDDYLSRVKDGWNNTIEETVHKLQKVDASDVASKTAAAATQLSQDAWQKTKPELQNAGKQAQAFGEQARAATSDAAEHTIEGTQRGLRRTAHQVQDATQGASNELAAFERSALEKSEEAKEKMRQTWTEAKEQSRELGEQAKEAASQANNKAAHFFEDTKHALSEKLERVKNAVSGKAQEAKQAVQGASQDGKQTADQILENVKQDAMLAKVDAVDRWRAMLDAKDETAKEKALLLQQYTGRRVGFESVNDPTKAAVVADAAAAGRVAAESEQHAKKSWWSW